MSGQGIVSYPDRATEHGRQGRTAYHRNLPDKLRDGGVCLSCRKNSSVGKMQASWGVHIMGVHLMDVSLSRACISGACISKGLHLSYELYEPLKIDLGDFRFWPLGSLQTGSGTTPRTPPPSARHF